ncbi:MAG: hypothetical protein JST32_20840, partial [Bacteroidetes bacterium]|nr:hypothetical protein [Bacteroidota bacterium]
AGLCVIASNTSAQAEFMRQYPQCGRLYPKGDRTALKEILLEWYHDRTTLLRLRRNAFDLAASELNWEKESEKFIDIVRGILQ